MAIDLCNKSVQMRVVGDPDSTEDGRRDGVEGADPLRAFLNENGHAHDTGATETKYMAADPAAWASDFGYAVDRVSMRIDGRSGDELRVQAFDHPDPVMREQALFEYADRNAPDAIDLLAAAVERDRDRQVRWDALWAIEKLGGLRALEALRRFRYDDDPEIAEWSRLFTSELQTGDPAFDDRGSRFTPGRTFDETLFLLIHCDLYVRLDPTNRVWGKLSLAPQGLARVYGQAHACPNAATREHTLVIAKTISGLHADGSPHVDNYLFRGFTERVRPDRGNFFFESHVRRPFYISGRADDRSRGVQDTHIGFMRQGCWYLDPRVQVRGVDAIRYVRGRFQGWGYVNLDRVAGKSVEEIILPGNAILSTLHDPVAGPLSNVFISGTFKGKLNDWDGDGHIDLNSRNVYSTVDGDVDMDMDGIPDQPGAACCSWVSPF